MQFRQLLLSRFSLLALAMLGLAVPVLAQDTATETAPAEWETTEAGDALTLVWQTSFTPETMLATPGDIAIDSHGNVYVSTQSANSVKKFDRDGNLVTEWGKGGDEDGEFSLSFGMGVDADNHVYVTDFYNLRIQKFESDGTFVKQWATEPSTSPAFMAIDPEGNIFIDQFPPHDDHFIQKFDSEGNLLDEWGNENKQFGGRIEDIAVDSEGNLYVADVILHRIQKFDPEGKLVATFGDEMSKDGNGLFDDPFGLAVDGEGYVYVLDGHFLQKLDWDGNFVAQWSTEGGDLDQASNVAVDAEGNIYVFARADVTAANGSTVNVPVLKKFSQS